MWKYCWAETKNLSTVKDHSGNNETVADSYIKSERRSKTETKGGEEKLEITETVSSWNTYLCMRTLEMDSL